MNKYISPIFGDAPEISTIYEVSAQSVITQNPGGVGEGVKVTVGVGVLVVVTEGVGVVVVVLVGVTGGVFVGVGV